jgi:TolB protein
MPNVEVRLSGARQESVLTNTSGFFEFGNLPRGDYVVSAVKPNFTFEPPSVTFTNLESTREVDFVGTERFRIAGRATSLFEGTVYALGGVSVTLSGGVSRTAVTDANGQYSFDDVPQAASFRVAAAKPGFVFTPASIDIIGPLDDDQVADFQAALASPLPGRIALAGAGGRIHVMNADGSGLVPVTAAGKAGAGDFDPRYSRDGRKLAFRRVCVSPLGGQPQLLNLGEIQVMNADGSDLDPLTDNSAAEFTDAGPAWSPDRRRIAFLRAPAGTPGTNEDLLVMNADGSGQVGILSRVPPALRAVGAPDWSPDGTRIVFSMSHERSNGRQIFLVDPDGANLIALTAGSPESFNPAWSPDGKRIAFSRKVGSGANPFAVFVMSADGRNVLRVATGALGDRLAWSPDGRKLAYMRRGAAAVGNELVVMNADGTAPLVVASGSISGPTWSETARRETPSGTDVEVSEGAAAITFGGVTASGLTTFTPIPATAAGGPPSGFVLGGVAFEITTSAEFTPPVTVCITVGPMSPAQFDSLALLHIEEGVLVDRTTSRDLTSRTVCGIVDSLSPFALAETVAPGAPTITGLVSDDAGNPLGGVTVSLSGTETRSGATGPDGLFTFANLEEGGNYSVEPELLGFLFDESQRDFVDLHGEQTVAFRATAASFRISGRVLSAPGDRGLRGISVTLEGSGLREDTTDARGRYSFDDVPAGGTYAVTPAGAGLTFTPGTEVLVDLTGDETDVDFFLEGSAEQEAVLPILECVADKGDGSFTAHFGYLNEGGAAVTIAIGRDNKFKPAPGDRGQPTLFQPGRAENVFSAVFRGRRLVWVLRGPDGRRHTAIALRDGPSCP